MRIRVTWILVLVAAMAAAVATRGLGFTSRRASWPLEEPAMRWARSWATPSAIRRMPNPVAPSSDVLKAGRTHWADHCATCHGNDGSGDAAVGRNLYPAAPDMRKAATQDMTDGELFYVIEKGIPFTGMPAWGTGSPDGEEASWALVRFIRHLPSLSPAELTEMEALNPRSPAETQRKAEIDDFLSGKN